MNPQKVTFIVFLPTSACIIRISTITEVELRILPDFEKIADKCTHMNGVQPVGLLAPENNSTMRLTFNKISPYNHKGNCDSYGVSFTNPIDY